MSKLILLAALVAAGLVAVLAGSVHPAKAAFPGADGRIAFSDDSTGQIWTIKPDGSDPRLVASPPDGRFDTEPAWSPDGKTIVFTEYGPGPASVWLVNPDGTSRHLLLNEDPNYGDAQGNWSPDGSRVIFRRCHPATEECSIYTVKTDGHGLTQITQPHQNAIYNNVDVKPEFSPDGSTISFSSFNRGGIQNGIYLMGAHGTGIHLITPTGLGAVDADWAPNGSKIAFWTHCCDPQTATIDTMNPDGSGITQLTDPGNEHDLRPSFSPQGDMIAFERDSADFSTSDIMVVPAAGGSPTTIRANANTPNWGPAGS